MRILMKCTFLILFLLLIASNCLSQESAKMTRKEASKVMEYERNRSVKNLIDSLGSIDSMEVAVAAYQLRMRGTKAKEAIPYLIPLLNDNRAIRSHSMFALRGTFLHDGTSPGQEAARALGKISPETLSDLQAAYNKYREESIQTKRGILYGILEIDTPESRSYLKSFIHDDREESYCRAFVIKQLVRREDIYDDLVILIWHSDRIIKTSALLAMAYSGHPEGIEHIIEVGRELASKPESEKHYFDYEILGAIREAARGLAQMNFRTYEELVDWWEANKDSIRTIR